MTDLLTIIAMLAKTGDDFEKKTITMNSGPKRIIITTSRGIEFNFEENGSLLYVCKSSK